MSVSSSFKLIDDEEMPEEDHLSPATFFSTEPLRRKLSASRRPKNLESLAGALSLSADRVTLDLTLLCMAGLVSASSPGRGLRAGTVYTLTPEGIRTLDWSAPPGSGPFDAAYAANLLRALCAHYRVEPGALATGLFGTPVTARSRLCHALFSRGWSARRIEQHFAFRDGWAERGVARWTSTKTVTKPSLRELS